MRIMTFISSFDFRKEKYIGATSMVTLIKSFITSAQ